MADNNIILFGIALFMILFAVIYCQSLKKSGEGYLPWNYLGGGVLQYGPFQRSTVDNMHNPYLYMYTPERNFIDEMRQPPINAFSGPYLF